ncbi:MAG: winged helix DNA-binding domain-containing protein [Chloroflexi bacterium]|nr:winged helix DNA-binding domain-containing protein [Chloroflexota bacterium]
MNTHLDIARRRLHNQGITETTLRKPSDVVAWLVTVQAQDFAGAKWALGLRLQGATDDDIDRAFADGSILRTHLMRPTWHFVTPADIRWMLALTAPRVHAVNAAMYRKLELDGAIFKRSNAALAKALQGGNQLTRDELREVLHTAGIVTAGELRMGYLMMRAELDGIVCSGARRGKQFTYALLDERAPHARTLERDEALAELASRYFMSRGPATVQDLAKWSGLTTADARRGLEAVKAQLRNETVDGQTYWFPAATPATKEVSPAAYLLSIYDEYMSGYKDRSAIVDTGHAVMLSGLGNALRFIIVVDGQIVGTWRRTLGKDAVTIETNLFRRLTQAENRAVEVVAQRYGEFLNLPVFITAQTAKDGR